MRYGKIILIAVFIWSGITALQARTYYLPDYQKDFIYGSRSQNDDSGQHISTPSCSTYGLYSAPQSNSECTRVNAPVPGLTCYSCTDCSPEYTYDSSNCSGSHTTSGSSCGGKYNHCICDTSLFPHTSLSCEHTLSGASCFDDDGTHYAECIDTTPCPNGGDSETEKSQKESNGFECVFAYEGYKTSCYTCSDPCEGLVDQDCGAMSCATYYAKCPLKCEVCQIEVSCENGFHQSADKLSCVADACEGYLDSCPANTLCSDTCQSGNNTKFKPTACSSGYYNPSTYWCMAKPFC